MRKTVLNDEHKKLGAKMVDFAGWEMPIQYKNLKEEVLAVRNQAGVFDVSHMGEFWVKGPEALKFVNHVIAGDIKNLKTGKAIYSPLLNDQGRILDDLIAYKIQEDLILICVNASNVEKDFNWFSKFKDGYDCEFMNVSEHMSLLALQGPKSFEILKKLKEFNELADLDYYGVQRLDTHLTVARTGYTGEDGFEIFADHEFIKTLWTDLLKLNVAPCGLGARDVLRLEVAYPLYGNDLSEELTPLDSGLKWTLKKDSTPYVGFEALNGYVPGLRLIKLTLDKGIPRAGYPILDSNNIPIGKITSGTMSVILGKGIALGLVNVNQLPENNEYYIDIRGKKYKATKTTKPFVVGSHK